MSLLKTSFSASCSIATVALALITSPALAQDGSTSDPDVEEKRSTNEIIVTAKSRRQSLQDVPLAVTALTSEDIAGAQIRDVRDLQKVTPNLSLFAGAGRNDPSGYSLRGIAPNTSDERYQGLSIFIDGIALSGQLASINLENVERVEVVRGPQAATFGRATYSGAINYVTADPNGDTVTGFVSARGSLTHSAPEASYNFSGTITTPIATDTLWLTLGATVFQNGAYARSTDGGAPIGRERTQLGTATLFFKPSDTFSIKLRGLYQHDRDSAAAQIVEHPRDFLQAGATVRPFARGNGSFFPDYLPDPNVDSIGTAGARGYSRDTYFGTAVVTKYFGDYELIYRGGYFKSSRFGEGATNPRASGPGQDPVFAGPLANGLVTINPFQLGTFPVMERFENTSQQLELLSPGDKAFRWRVGGYYFWEEDTTTFPKFVNPSNPTGLFNQSTISNVAGFAGFDWDLTSALTLSGEGRYARETLRNPACPTCVFTPTFQAFNNVDKTFSPRVTLSYKLTPDNLIYGLYSEGTKSARFSFARVAGTNTGIIATPERLYNYEIGSKNSFFDGALTLNLAAFYERVRDQQLVASRDIIANGQAATVAVVSNVGASEILGFEAETNWKVTSKLTLRGSVGYAHQEFTSKTPIIISRSSTFGFPVTADGSVVLDGFTQANVPDWNGFISGEYELPDVGGFATSFRVDGAYRGSFDALLSDAVKVRSSWSVDARLNLNNDVVDLSVFGRNILNNQRATGSGLAGATVSCLFVETDTATFGNNQQCIYASVPRPAEFGLEAKLRF